MRLPRIIWNLCRCRSSSRHRQSHRFPHTGLTYLRFVSDYIFFSRESKRTDDARMANVTWNRHRDARGRAIFIIYKEIAGTLLILCHCRPMKRLWRNRSRFAAHRQQPLPRVQQFPFARIPPPPPRPIFGKAPNRRSIPPEFRDQRRARKSADSKAPATSPGFRVIDPISDELSSSRRGRGRIENFFFSFFPFTEDRCKSEINSATANNADSPFRQV